MPDESPTTNTTTPRCLSCGFALLAHTTGRCPECGVSVERSLRGDFLANASPRYVARIRDGMTLVIVGSIAGVLWWVATPLILAIGVQQRQLSPRGAEILIQSIDFGSQLLLLAGWWLVSTPNPAVVDPGADAPLRRTLRALLVVLTIVTGIGFIGAFVPALSKAGLGAVSGSIHIGPNTQFSSLFILGIILRVALLIAKVGRFVVGLLYLRHLVAKIPNPTLESALRRQIWAFPLLMTVGVACVGLGPIIGVVWYLVVLMKTRRAIERERERASHESVPAML